MPKYHISQIDIIIILIVTLCTIIVYLPIFTFDLTLIKDAFSISFLFILGYTVLMSIFPIKSPNITKGVLYSFSISIGLMLLIVMLENIFLNFLGITLPDSNILLAIITIIFAIFAYIRRKKCLNTVETKNWITCQKCGGYYELQEGESLDDFEKCQCGGKLYNTTHNHRSIEKNKSLETPKAKKGDVLRELIIDKSLIIFIAILSIVSVIIPQLSGSIVRMASVSILIFFLSGYALATIIFPSKEKTDKIKRFALSIPLSIVVVLLLRLGFSLNQFIAPPITSILIISAITVSLIIISVIRNYKYLKEEINEFNEIPSEKYESKTLTGMKMEEKRLSKSQEKYESKTLTGMKMEEKRVSNSQEKFENLTEEKQISKSRNLPIDLILILLATISCLIFEFTVPNKSFVEIIFGLLFVLFLPGYSLIAVLFPKKNDLEKMERMALSFGLSMLIAPIVGLFLNSTFYGINLTPLTIILAIFTIVVEIFAFIRRQNVPEDDRFIVEFKNYFSKTTEEDGVKDR